MRFVLGIVLVLMLTACGAARHSAAYRVDRAAERTVGNKHFLLRTYKLDREAQTGGCNSPMRPLDGREMRTAPAPASKRTAPCTPASTLPLMAATPGPSSADRPTSGGTLFKLATSRT